MKQSLSNVGKNQSEVMEKLSSISEEVSNYNNIFLDMSRLIAVFEEAQDSVNHAAIIRGLKPLSAHTRESEINRHHRKTFEWIIEPEYESQGQPDLHNISFVDWLKHGSGVFHFAGKPGSGKSTLFKFLANDYRVRQSLEEWAVSAKKQLVLSKFFFWMHGSNDQKSVPGLLRGLLYEMCMDNPCITKLLFPCLWGKGRLEREMAVKDDDIRTAFDQMFTNQEIRRGFRLCFFIDGLDEFNGEETTHWKLARILQKWTHQPAESTSADSFLKLCVSSREDHSIMSVFQTLRQIRLQDITKRDVSAIVEDTLLGNEYFEQLQKKDASGCQELIRSILQGAEGVFLWVSLLLNLLEDELPGVSSVAALQSIVRTTPLHLEDFISKILDTIRKHHRRGAYFVLTMALRMIGLHLSDNGKFPTAEQNEYQTIFGVERYWRPHLYTYGLSAVLETLETGNTSEGYGVVLASLVDEEHETRSQDAAVKIRTWCRGLLDVINVDQRDITSTFDRELWDTDSESKSSGYDRKSESGSDSGREFTFVKFTHRSIPDFLMSVIQNRATEYGFDDDDVAKGIIAMLIAETTSSYNDTQPLAHNLGYYLQHILHLLRLRAISESSPIFPMLEELELARFHAYRRTNHVFLSECQDFTSRLDALRGSHQEFLVSWDDSGSLQAFHEAFLPWNGSATVLTHASHAGLHEYIRWKLENNSEIGENPALLFSALGGLSTYYSFFWTEYPRCYTSTLRLLLNAGAPLDVPVPVTPVHIHPNDNDYTYLVRIWHVLEFLARDKALHPKPNPEGPDHLAGWTWLVVLPSIMHTLIISTMDRKAQCTLQLWEFLEVWLEFGAMPPVDIVYAELEILRKEGIAKQVAVRYKVPVHSKYRNRVHVIKSGFKTVSEGEIMSRLGTSKGVSLADLVKSHRPPNTAILLGYIDRNLAVVRGKMRGQTGLEEI